MAFHVYLFPVAYIFPLWIWRCLNYGMKVLCVNCCDYVCGRVTFVCPFYLGPLFEFFRPISIRGVQRVRGNCSDSQLIQLLITLSSMSWIRCNNNNNNNVRSRTQSSSWSLSCHSLPLLYHVSCFHLFSAPPSFPRTSTLPFATEARQKRALSVPLASIRSTKCR
jgi:hypothetical protein